jgi:hypothetical protein
MCTRIMPTALAGGAARRTAAQADGGRAGTATAHKGTQRVFKHGCSKRVLKKGTQKGYSKRDAKGYAKGYSKRVLEKGCSKKGYSNSGTRKGHSKRGT